MQTREATLQCDVAIELRVALSVDFTHPTETEGEASRAWDVAPDGRLLMVKDASTVTVNRSDGIVHVQNWVGELKRLVPKK
jgi:hypothetical protein